MSTTRTMVKNCGSELKLCTTQLGKDLTQDYPMKDIDLSDQ